MVRKRATWLVIGVAAAIAIAAVPRPTTAEPGLNASTGQEAATQISARLGDMRGAIGPETQPALMDDRSMAQSVTGSIATSAVVAVLPRLPAFAGPISELTGAPDQQVMRNRPVRIVYGGQFFGADADHW